MDAGAGAEQVYQGRLGRTTRTSVLISSVAGPVFPASVYTGINVTQDPELRDRLHASALNEVACPFSERTYQLAIPLRYHDEARKLFVLVIPEALRHEEFKHRSDMLQELARERELLPDYVRHFETVFSVEELATLEVRADAPAAAPPAERPIEVASGRIMNTLPMAALSAPSALPAPPARAEHDLETAARLEEAAKQAEREREALAKEREAMAAARQQLEQEQQQLHEVSERLERERARMEQVEDRIVAERDQLAASRAMIEVDRASVDAERATMEAARLQLEQERQQLIKQQLQAEQERLRLEQVSQVATPEEKTQIVTDDQFIEVMGESLEEPSDGTELVWDEGARLGQPAPAPTSSLMQEVALSESFEDDFGPEDSTQITQVPTLRHLNIAARFDQKLAGGQDLYLTIQDGHVVAAIRTQKREVDQVIHSGSAAPQLLLQYALVERYPLVTILLARLDAQQQLVHAFGWPLDVANDNDRLVLDALMVQSLVRFAFYDPQGKLLRTYDARAPLEENARWIKARAEGVLTEPGRKPGRFSKAAAAFSAPDYERLGTMRHAFSADSFQQISSPSAAKLAAGIVGYWSGEDVFEYLIGNRAFPLKTFRAIQQRVAEHALDYGIYLPAPLRQFTIERAMVEGREELAKRLFANFAEVCVGLKTNDLDPVEQWENWDALFSLAQEVGVQVEQEIIDLAQLSLRRAQEFELGDDVEPRGDEGEEVDDDAISEVEDDEVFELSDEDVHSAEDPTERVVVLDSVLLRSSGDPQRLTVSKRSEVTGVTYFLPDDAVLDQFDDLASLSREELVSLLDDPKGRLEAAQLLIERFGAPCVATALERSEQMSAPEIAALARFVETRADGLEVELVRAVEQGGPSATYIAARALVSIRSTSAIPTLLDAARDPARQGNLQALVAALGGYGDRLVPQLMRLIKRDGHDDALIAIIQAVEQRSAGAIARLARDRNKRVREAARLARQ